MVHNGTAGRQAAESRCSGAGKPSHAGGALCSNTGSRHAAAICSLRVVLANDASRRLLHRQGGCPGLEDVFGRLVLEEGQGQEQTGAELQSGNDVGHSLMHQQQQR